MYSKGADVDALRDSAGRMAAYGRDVDQVLARSRHAVSVVRRAWAGPDLGQVLERWRRVEADLTRISGRFGDLSRRLEHHADAQQRSSAGHGGQALGGHGGSGHSGHGGSGHGGSGHGGSSSGGSGGPGAHGGQVAGHGGGRDSVVADAGWHAVLAPWLPHVWGPDGGRPLVGAAQWQGSHPGAGMAWGQLVGTGWHGAGTMPGGAWQSSAPVEWAPFAPASVPALAAHQLGLPVR